MSKERGVVLEKAKMIYQDVENELGPFCVRIACAGSVRREIQVVNDIEIVCIPKLIDDPSDLFVSKLKRCEGFVNTINKWEKSKGDPAKGKYTQRIHTSGIQLDIFIVNEDNWGLHFVIRTGSANYSKWLLHKAIKAAGYYSKDGYVHDGTTNEVVPVREEIDFYNLIGVPCVLPPFRVMQ